MRSTHRGPPKILHVPSPVCFRVGEQQKEAWAVTSLAAADTTRPNRCPPAHLFCFCQGHLSPSPFSLSRLFFAPLSLSLRVAMCVCVCVSACIVSRSPPSESQRALSWRP